MFFDVFYGSKSIRKKLHSIPPLKLIIKSAPFLKDAFLKDASGAGAGVQWTVSTEALQIRTGSTEATITNEKTTTMSPRLCRVLPTRLLADFCLRGLYPSLPRSFGRNDPS